MMETIISAFYPEVSAGGFSRHDGTVEFYSRVQALLRRDQIVLDFGAGRGAAHYLDDSLYRKRLRDLRGEGRRVIGADIDTTVTTNPSIDQAVVIDQNVCLPFCEKTFDIIVSDWTFEHIVDPKWAASELDRVLKSGGWLCARTPNRNGYVALANRVVGPFSDRIIFAAQPDRQAVDIFPTVYRMNSVSALRMLFPPDHYDHASYAFDSEPRYYFNSKVVFALMLMLQSFTPPALRTTLMCFIQKR